MLPDKHCSYTSSLHCTIAFVRTSEFPWKKLWGCNSLEIAFTSADSRVCTSIWNVQKGQPVSCGRCEQWTVGNNYMPSDGQWRASLVKHLDCESLKTTELSPFYAFLHAKSVCFSVETWAAQKIQWAYHCVWALIRDFCLPQAATRL